MPGWDLNVTWFTEEGLPKKGILAFEVFAGDGLNLSGCLVDKRLRNMMTVLALVDQRDLQQEVEAKSMLNEEHNMVFKRGSKAPVNYYPDLTHPGNHVRPTLPLLKLITQSDMFPLLGKSESAGGVNSVVRYTIDDVTAHLGSTEIGWNYTSTNQKTEPWSV